MVNKWADFKKKFSQKKFLGITEYLAKNLVKKINVNL